MSEPPKTAVGTAVAKLAAAINAARTGLDTSNYTRAPNAGWQAWVEAGVAAIFPQALNPPAGYPPGVTAQQVQWGLDNGLLVVPYIWKWFGTGIGDVQRRLDLLSPFAGQLHHVMLDVEDTTVGVLAGVREDERFVTPPPEHLARLKRQPPPIRPRFAAGASFSLQQRIDELSAAYEVLDTFPTISGLPSGYYGAKWYHDPYLGGTAVFAEQGRGLWVAAYDGIPDPGVFASFGGYTNAAVKQYQGTTTFHGIGGVDMNALNDEYLAATPSNGGGGSIDQGWQDRRNDVVEAAGELKTVADQLDGTTAQIDALLEQARQLTEAVRERANFITG